MSESGRVVYMNGRLVPESDARVSIYDSALMFGDMVFEMTRSFNGNQFKLREHVERLFASMKMVRIDLDMTIEDVMAAVEETIDANRDSFADDDEHRVMIDVTRGLLSIYQGVVGAQAGPNLIIADFPLRWTVAGMSSLWETGINAVITAQRAIPGHLLDPKVKSRSRMHYLMANIEVSNQPGEDNWALLLDPDGYVAEGTGDNFFIVVDGVLSTPEPRNILRGISRDYVITELAPSLGLECRERDIELYDVVNADEAFMTGTPFCILPVTRINGAPIGDGTRGRCTEALVDSWSSNVGVDIPAQITSWDEARGTSPHGGTSPYRFKSRT